MNKLIMNVRLEMTPKIPHLRFIYKHTLCHVDLIHILNLNHFFLSFFFIRGATESQLCMSSCEPPLVNYVKQKDTYAYK